MIDIHCHILPDLDDGAADLKESLAMARQAADSGVTGIVATPHFRGDPESLKDLPRVLDACARLSAAIQRSDIPVQLLPGAEILCTPRTPELARNKSLPTLGDTDYLLTEFFFDESAGSISGSLRALADYGYKPVVAHPERYDAVQQNPGLLEEWFRRGYVIQLNKGSVLGAFGPRAEWVARIALYHGLAHIIASDAHTAVRRTTNMHPLRQRLRDLCPPEYVRILLEENPRRLVQDMDMVPIT